MSHNNKHLPFPPEIAHNPKPKPIPSTYRPPLQNSAWSSSQLSTKPFWETTSPQQSQQQPQSNAPVSPPSPPLATTNWGTQTLDQHATTTTTTTTASSPPFAGTNWGTQSFDQHTTAAASSSPPLAGTNWGTKTFDQYITTTIAPADPQQQPSPVPSPQSSMTRKQRRSLGSYASKYATTRPPSTSAQADVTPPAPPVVAPSPAPAPPTTTTSDHEPIVISGTISLAALLAPLPPPAPPTPKSLFDLNIELIPGVTTILPVHETDDCLALVKQFATKHELNFAADAQLMFAKKIEQMVAELKVLQDQGR